MKIQIAEMLILLGVCLYTDLQEQKIKNKYVLPLAVIGFITNCVSGNVGWFDSLLGLFLPFLIFFPFFFLRMFRAGDIKAMMALGAIMGYRFVGNAIFYIFGVGLVIALIKMIRYGNAKERIQNVGKYLWLLLRSFQPAPYEKGGEYDKTIHFPFSFAIAVGAVINLIMEYRGFYIFWK